VSQLTRANRCHKTVTLPIGGVADTYAAILTMVSEFAVNRGSTKAVLDLAP